EEVVSTDSEEKDRFFLAIPYDALGGINYSTVQTVHIQLTDPELLPLVQREVEALFEREQISALFVPYNAPTGYVASVRAIYTDNLRFIMVVLAVTVFFSIAIVFNLSIAERAKELGTMRTFGMKKKHLTLLFQIEAFCLALYGYSLGSLTAFVSGVVINYYGGIRLPPPPTVYKPIVVGYAFSPPYVCISLALVVLVAQFSSFMVTRRLGTLSVIEQLTQIT
ncbi:MAG TPA: FtsX-like permease family protein, partial [Termitinemataceae bacterium]|nr:FtsX-like permease family protein [Termitinemataceae bacterium]